MNYDDDRGGNDDENDDGYIGDDEYDDGGGGGDAHLRQRSLLPTCFHPLFAFDDRDPLVKLKLIVKGH